MHIDENKRFDKRNIEKNVKDGIITGKDYEMFLSKFLIQDVQISLRKALVLLV